MPPLYHLCRFDPQETFMIKTILILCCLISALLLLACSKTEPAPGNTASAPANKTAPASTPATSTASNTDKIGVTECDDFLTAYEACVHNKVPATAQAQFNQAMADWRKQWRTLAANPQTKPTLITACKSALETSKTSMKAYGCTF
jgi:hypothetical protein